jgi:hypothetical protein
MTIYYLIVKTHKITGLKYLCQTKRQNPHEYLGSGTHWKRHLNKHGTDIFTEIIRECQSKDELTKWGLHYSELWNVVAAKNEHGKKIWANLKPESGEGGMTDEIHARGEKTKKENGINLSAALKVASRRKSNGTYIRTPEMTQKQLNTWRENGGQRRSKESYTAMGKRMIENEHTLSPDTVIKMQATLKAHNRGVFQVKTCEHCGRDINGATNYVRWHGDKCKSRS